MVYSRFVNVDFILSALRLINDLSITSAKSTLPIKGKAV